MNGSETFMMQLTALQAEAFANDATYTLEHQGWKYFRARVFRREAYGDNALLTFTYERRAELDD